MSWLLAFLGFALLIIFHELGHFAAAKAVGMRVEKFFLFFGKPLWSVTRGETTYGIAAIPLGGYVKITGMNPEEARELPPELYARSYAGSKVWKRIFVILAGPVVNVIIAFVLLGGIFLSQGRFEPGVAVADVDPAGAAAGQLRDGDLLLSVTAPASGTGASRVAAKTLPAHAPGLTEDQVTKRINGVIGLISAGGCGAKPLGTKGADGNPQFAACSTAAPIGVTVDRAGQRRTLEITPTYDQARKRYRLGLGFNYPREDVGVVGAADGAVDQMWFVTTATLKAMVKVVYDSEARKDVSSVVGGYETTRQSIEISTVQALSVLALISLSLAIINLFPFLPLDGGHIFWSIVEKLRGGKPVSTLVLERASIVGFMLVIMLFLIGVTNDIGRISSGEGFGVR